MNVNIKNKEKSMQNIDNACNNFKNISSNIQNSKFEHIDTWLKKTSIVFKKENTNKLLTETYPRYDYDTIVKVDLGVNIGSELSGPHYGITLDKYDSTKNPVTTNKELILQKQNESKIIKKMIDYYSNYAKSSYACINQITTISKNKIIRPKNKYDIIGRAKCNNEIMKIISKEIIKKYTNYTSIIDS